MLLKFEADEHVHEILRAFRERSPKPVQHVPEKDVWVASSALQKAVRRGLTREAEKAAKVYLNLEPEKFWRRLRVIALEDVGCANLHLCATVLRAGSKRWRNSICEDAELASALVTTLAKSPKSRVANDLLCIAHWHPYYNETAKIFAGKAQNELSDIYLDAEKDPVVRTIAARYLCGFTPRGVTQLYARKGSCETFLALHNTSYCPDSLRETMQLAIRGGLSLGQSLAIAWTHKRGKRVHHVNDIRENPPRIGYWLSPSWDVHVRRGQQAYGQLVGDNNPIARFLTSNVSTEHRMRALGMAIFATEGMLLDKREIYRGLDDFLSKAVGSYVAPYGLDEPAKDDFLRILDTNFELVHRFRRKSVNGRI